MAVIDDVSSEFDVQRKKATQAVNANVQAKRDAISRAAARSGGGPGGAFVKVEQKAIDEGGRQLADANETIDTAQRGEMRRLREVQEGRDFTKSERIGSQDFAAGQADLGRKFTTSERLGGQEFVGNQAAIQRGWQTGEREAGQKFATGEREAGQTFAHGERLESQDYGHNEAAYARDTTERMARDARAMDDAHFQQQYGLSAAQFEHEKYVDSFNQDLATRIQAFNEKNPGIFEGIFGDGFNQRLGGAGNILSTGYKAADTLTMGALNPTGILATGARARKGRLF